MPKEMNCPKCGATYMGDPWVDDCCEKCSSGSTFRQKPTSIPSPTMGDALSAGEIQPPRNVKTTVQEISSNLRSAKGREKLKRDRQDKTTRPVINDDLHGPATIRSIDKDAFVWLRENFISVDLAGLKTLLRDNRFLLFFGVLAIVLFLRFGMSRVVFVDTTNTAMLCIHGFYILWLIVFSCYILQKKKLLLLSLLSIISTFFIGGILRRTFISVAQELLDSPRSQMIIDGVGDSALWFVSCGLYILYSHKILKKHIDKNTIIIMCMSAALIEPFMYIGRLIRRAYEMNLSFTKLLLWSFSECFMASSFAVMSASFILLALSSKRRRYESIICAMIPSLVYSFMPKPLLNPFLVIVLTVGSLILLFGYLSMWGIYPLRLKSSHAIGSIAKTEQQRTHVQRDRFCPQCGAPQLSNAKFCSKCGGRLSS